MEAKEKVLEVLKKSGSPMKVGDIVSQSGLDKKLVEKAMKELKNEDKIFSPIRCCWQIK
ncbi:MAG: MarR family transcriptional regulator [Bacteroidales bacterium]|nr:MarR family transcriptional regulator [Bacteroidales bacterium]